MDPISAVASVIAIYQLASTVSGLCFRYAQGVRGADRDADLVINEIDTFQKYLRTLKDVLVREEAATDGFCRLPNLNEIINGEAAALKLCQRDLEEIKTKLIKVQSEGRFKEVIHKLSWPLKREEVRKTLHALKSFTEAVDRAVNVDNNEVIRVIDDTTKRIERSLESAESQGAKEKILDWLSHPDPSKIHENVRHDRNDRAKTGRWFLDGSVFQEFKATSQSILWLHGDSGCGKSVLCSAVIDEILATQSEDSRTELAYWYFSVTDKKRTMVDSLLRSLIAQLIIKSRMPRFLLDLWKAGKMGREAPKSIDLSQTVQNVLVTEPSQRYFIVIDALDESDEKERDEIMQLVRSLALLEVEIHILISSRTTTVGVEKGLKELASVYSIAMEGQDTDLDIVNHVTDCLENDDDLVKWSPELRQSIKKTLIEDAGGMFRWVECQLQAVRECRKPNDVRKVLKTLPKNLHEIYARELAKVDDGASQDVFRLLEWLAFPQQVLRIEEAIDMLAVDLESNPPAFDVENRLVDSEEILRMCGSLVRVDINADGRNDMGDVAKVQTLTAAHTSVIDFLKTQPIKIGSEEVLKLSRTQANLRMAETCLTYLRYFFENDITLTKDNIARYPFARVCALIWDDLYREVLASSERVDTSRLNSLVMELFSSPAAILNWIKLYNPDGFTEMVNFKTTISEVKPAIYYAAHLGLPDIVQSLIEKGHPMDEVVGPRFGTPLVAASAMGRAEVVSLLLESGADPNMSGYFYYGTPLAAATQFDRVEVVQLLLGKEGVDINSRRYPPMEATEEVCEWVEEYRYLQERVGETENEHKNKRRNSRCIEVGKKLIELGQNASAGGWGDKFFRDTYGSNEMINADFKKETNHWAQSMCTKLTGKSDCCIPDDLEETQYQIFLRRVTTASNRIMRSSQSIVYIAVEYEVLDILEILLAAGADPNVRGGYHGTALQRVCTHDDSDDIVKTLLENGARTDIYGGFCGSSLNVACSFGSLQMIEKLIAAGADVNRIDTRYSSPLNRASRWERADVVNLLIKHGAEPDLYPDEEERPLLLAAGKGNIKIAQLCLDAGSDVNRKESTGLTPLYAACLNCHKEMVGLLLAHDANPNIQQCGTLDHALQEACETGDEEIVDLLLESGAKTDLYGGYYGNALQAACDSGYVSVLRMLLSHGADINWTDWRFGSPLVTACIKGTLEIAKFLVEAGANLCVTNMIGHSALLTAVLNRESQPELLDYLIHQGASPSQEDKRGCNGLHYAACAKKGDATKKMIEYGVNVNATDHNGWTALHWAVACTENSVCCTRLLLQSGCDKTIEDKQGRTALDLARNFKRAEEVAILSNTAQMYKEVRTEEELLAQAHNESPEDEVSSIIYLCDGCDVDRRYCKPESWYKCEHCTDFDFCFRCILDKDLIHFKDHLFSSEPA